MDQRATIAPLHAHWSIALSCIASVIHRSFDCSLVHRLINDEIRWRWNSSKLPHTTFSFFMIWANFTSNTPPEGRVKLEFSKPSEYSRITCESSMMMIIHTTDPWAMRTRIYIYIYLGWWAEAATSPGSDRHLADRSRQANRTTSRPATAVSVCPSSWSAIGRHSWNPTVRCSWWDGSQT